MFASKHFQRVRAVIAGGLDITGRWIDRARRADGHEQIGPGERPFDPDELPIEALQTDEERRFAESLPARVWAPGGSQVDHHDGKGHPSGRGNGRDEPFLKGRPFNLRAIAGRLLGGD